MKNYQLFEKININATSIKSILQLATSETSVGGKIEGFWGWIHLFNEVFKVLFILFSYMPPTSVY